LTRKFDCCGYYSDLDRPFITSKCAGFVTSANIKRSEISGPERTSLKSMFKRQVYDPNPNVVPTIPGCHDKWVGFLVDYFTGVAYFSFAMIPFSFVMFIVSILTVNHLYMD
jgi:hypothetical protein